MSALVFHAARKTMRNRGLSLRTKTCLQDLARNHILKILSFCQINILRKPHTYGVPILIWLLESINEAMDQFSSLYIPASVLAWISSSLSLQSAECHVGHLPFLAVRSHGVHLNCIGSAWVSESYPMRGKKQKVSTRSCIHDFF